MALKQKTLPIKICIVVNIVVTSCTGRQRIDRYPQLHI